MKNLEQLLLEVVLEEARGDASLGGQALKKDLSVAADEVKNKTSQAIDKANEAGKIVLQKLKDSGILEKAKKELTDPENAKKVKEGGKKAISTLLKVLNATMGSEKKRSFIGKFLVNPLLLGGGVAKIWDMVRASVENQTAIDTFFLDKPGISLPDPALLDTMGDILPAIVAIRVLMFIYAGRDAFMKEGDLNENEDFITSEMESMILKGLDKSIGA